MTDFEAFILIGGKSTRLGTDKASVKLGGMTLSERAVLNVRDALPEAKITMVAGNSTRLAMGAIATDLPFIFDLYEARGPLGGLHAALADATTSWIFVIACDYPFVSPKIIRKLKEGISDDFGVVLPQQRDGRLQPLCAFYKVESARPVIEEILLANRVPPPMHEIVRKLDPLVIGLESKPKSAEVIDPFININTIKDLELAERAAEELTQDDS